MDEAQHKKMVKLYNEIQEDINELTRERNKAKDFNRELQKQYQIGNISQEELKQNLLKNGKVITDLDQRINSRIGDRENVQERIDVYQRKQHNREYQAKSQETAKQKRIKAAKELIQLKREEIDELLQGVKDETRLLYEANELVMAGKMDGKKYDQTQKDCQDDIDTYYRRVNVLQKEIAQLIADNPETGEPSIPVVRPEQWGSFA